MGRAQILGSVMPVLLFEVLGLRGKLNLMTALERVYACDGARKALHPSSLFSNLLLCLMGLIQPEARGHKAIEMSLLLSLPGLEDGERVESKWKIFYTDPQVQQKLSWKEFAEVIICLPPGT